MIVYVVFNDNTNEIDSVWSSETLAEKRIAELHKYGSDYDYCDFYLDEKEC